LPAVPEERFDVDSFVEMPRLLTMHASPDGARLALTVQRVAADGKRLAGSIWEIETTGDAPPRLLAAPDSGATVRGFLPDGSLLYTAPRPAADTVPGEPAGGTGPGVPGPDVLLLLPASGGDPRTVLAPDAGIGEVLTARSSSTVVVTAAMHPGTISLAEDEARQRARKDAGVAARLVDHYPDRYWDHDLGPRQPRLLAIDPVSNPEEAAPVRDLTPVPPWAGWLEDVQLCLSDDGARVVFGAEPHTGPRFKADLAMLDTSGHGAVRILIDADSQHGAVAWSPDGTTIAVSSAELGRPGAAGRFRLQLVDTAGVITDLAPHWEGHALEIRWTRDGRALIITADEQGHTPVFRVDLDGTVTRLTASGAYRNLVLSSDGARLYAIRSHIDEPPAPVALDLKSADQEPRRLPHPAAAAGPRTRLEEITVAAADGASIHSWLVLPEDAPAAPLPLAVLIHGGPVSSWAGWHWRWSAAVLAAHGWAVLLPNPRLSTGYGHAHIAAAWGDWATLPAADILASIDAAAGRADIDGERVAALGGSYGGYMANWLAVTSDRFRAIVTHASVWDLAAERDGSDVGIFMDRDFGDPLGEEDVWRRQSPHRRADSLRTPMLVIHGARDQRVPIHQASSLWTALQIRGVPSRLLLFPDENHWILKPQNTGVWYRTVLAFLDENVLDRPWRRPELL
jgi:dipeptidyl aminopeptidase/acylaminoacyl peptidase